jgi:hypothetical protein
MKPSGTFRFGPASPSILVMSLGCDLGLQPRSRTVGPQTATRGLWSFKFYRPDGSFRPHEQCPMGDLLTARCPGRMMRKRTFSAPMARGLFVIVNMHANFRFARYPPATA